MNYKLYLLLPPLLSITIIHMSISSHAIMSISSHATMSTTCKNKYEAEAEPPVPGTKSTDSGTAPFLATAPCL